VLADGPAFVVDHAPRRLRQIAVEEFPERPLADEADAGRILLGVVRQPGLEREAAHLGLLELAHREHRARQLFLRQAVQEVTLVFALIGPAKQFVPVFFFSNPCVVPGGDLLGAQAHGVVQERAELDLGVAQHVRIGRAAGGVLAQELGEHALLVLGGEVHRLELDADRVGRRGGVDQVFARGAVLVVVVVLPVLHEDPDDLVPGALQEKRGHRRVHSARHSDDDFHWNSEDSSASG
jgi:hypothetical protein